VPPHPADFLLFKDRVIFHYVYILFFFIHLPISEHLGFPHLLMIMS
jgi:hypothetical protein